MTIWSAEIKELEKLHYSIKGKHPKLYNELQRLIKTNDENIVLVYARRCLEIIITDLCEREMKRDRGTEPLKGIIDKLNREKTVPHNIIVSMQNLNSLSSFGAHPKDFDPRQVKPVLLDLTTVLDWYLKYMETLVPSEIEPGGPEEIRKEPVGVKKVTAGSKKRILLASAIVLVCTVVIVAVILTDVIKGGKDVKAGEIKSLVVLPFHNYTGDDNLEYFVSGMHSSLIGDMGKVSGLRILSETTSNVYKNVEKPVPEIASELGVDAVVEPTLTRFGDSICLQVKVYSAFPDEKLLWVTEYKEDIRNILALYSRITKQIAEEVKVELTPEEDRLLGKSRTVDREAYENYLIGGMNIDDLSQESLLKARDYLNSAIKKDPDWAPLYATMAAVWVSLATMGYESPEIAIPRTYENLNRALKLDPDHAEAHYMSAFLAFTTEWNWEKAEDEFLKTLAINPNHALARMHYSYILYFLQRPEEGLAQAKLAYRLDPLNPLIQTSYGHILCCEEDCDSALSIFETILASDPDYYYAWDATRIAAARCGDLKSVFESETHILPLEEGTMKKIEKIYNEKGFYSAYEEIIRHMEVTAEHQYVLPVDMALRCYIINQDDKAMDWLEKGFELHDPNLPFCAFSLMGFKRLYDNPRFVEIAEKMKLPVSTAN
jgi:TolB-like protein/Tfp pilus assembly protein PilF